MFNSVPRTGPGSDAPTAPSVYGTAGSTVPWNARYGTGCLHPSWKSTATVANAAIRPGRAHV